VNKADQNLNSGHVTDTTPVSGRIFNPWGGTCHSRSTCQI